MKKMFFRALVAMMAGLAISPAFAWRGGFGGGGFVARGPNGGVVAGDWHGGGAAGWGGTWHGDGWHAGGWGGYGYHGPVVVNSYYGAGCYACGAAAAGAAIGAAAAANAVARNYAIGMSLATLPTGCVDRIVNGESFYICDGAWLAPRFGNNGVYYVVVNPM
jgi:hypothetical protein